MGVRVLGIDPGSRATGWALVIAEGNRYQLETCGRRPAARRPPARHGWPIFSTALQAVVGELRPRLRRGGVLVFGPQPEDPVSRSPRVAA